MLKDTEKDAPVLPRQRLADFNMQEWTNLQTGEKRIVQEVDVAATDKGFEKVWLGALLQAVDVIGNKKLKVAKYLLEKRSRTENTVTVTQRQIAQDLGVSYPTVNETIQALKEANFIKQVVPGHYILNPGVIFRGSHHSRMAIMLKFSEAQRQHKLPGLESGEGSEPRQDTEIAVKEKPAAKIHKKKKKRR